MLGVCPHGLRWSLDENAAFSAEPDESYENAMNMLIYNPPIISIQMGRFSVMNQESRLCQGPHKPSNIWFTLAHPPKKKTWFLYVKKPLFFMVLRAPAEQWPLSISIVAIIKGACVVVETTL